MEIKHLEELLHTNFNLVFINALKQYWHTERIFQCIGAPKKQNLLLYLNGCRITYTTKDGKSITAESGDVVYAPMGSEYRAQVSDFEGQDSHTIGINFFLMDADAQLLILSDNITVFRGSDRSKLTMLFNGSIRQGEAFPLLQSRLVLMQILQLIAQTNTKTMPPAKIAVALEYLSEHLEESPSVSWLAALCNISEVYFRRQFKQSMGMTPTEYRNALRLNKAKSYLEYGDISVQEISDTLGYATVSHFIKAFRLHTGYSPLQYRKRIQNGLQ